MRRLFRALALSTASLSGVAALCAFVPSVPVAAADQAAPQAAGSQATPSQPARPSAFNSGERRAPEDPVKVARGKALYGASCQACHGADLRGGDMGGPNLLRSQVTLTDQHGENIIPIIQGARQAQGMPNIGLNTEDAGAVAAYVRSVVGTIGSQGRPPGEEKVLDIVVGDAARGKTYFQANCASCHSGDGDMKGLSAKFPDTKRLQARWIAGGPTSALGAAPGKLTADVTVSPGHVVSGSIVHIDDFLVTLRLTDGTQQSFQRKDAAPKVVVHDPLEPHRNLLQRYTDSDIHDVTAYLVTLK